MMSLDAITDHKPISIIIKTSLFCVMSLNNCRVFDTNNGGRLARWFIMHIIDYIQVG